MAFLIIKLDTLVLFYVNYATLILVTTKNTIMVMNYADRKHPCLFPLP